MAYEIHIGDTVEWNRGNSTGSGKVTERLTSKVRCAKGGTEVMRDASLDQAASLVELSDGDRVLESSTELS